MLLTEIIKNSNTAIQTRRRAIENKQHAESYAKALVQLNQVTGSIKGVLDCATAMKECGIVETPILEENARNQLLSCIDNCGQGVSELSLTMETVRLLKKKGEIVSGQIKIVWKDSSQKYAEGSKGYLSIIGGLSPDPKRAKELADNINKTISSDPTIKGIRSLMDNVSEAQQIAEAFSLNPQIESFLKKVSSQQATVFDLTPDVLTWLKEKNLMNKLKIRF